MSNPHTTKPAVGGPRASRRIPAGQLDPDALKVVDRLARHGHTAYFVGGCVRDLLLGRSPKDYDVGTTARPRQVKGLFRNSRIIGRRFRLVHVVFGRKIIEVATFRSQDPDATSDTDTESPDPMIRTDNVYGTPKEDAFRRDFTVNGLFYEPKNAEVIDYVGGLPDLDSGVIRSIGDPQIRMREDPVRMIRAVKFAARLGFAIHPPTYDAIVRYRTDVGKSATPRIAEEIVRLAKGGCALESFRLLSDVGLLKLLLPRVYEALAARVSPLSWKRINAIDDYPGGAEALTRSTLLAVLYSPVFDAVVDGEDPGRARDFGALFTAAVRPAVTDRLLSRREADRIKQILVAQRRLESDPRGKRSGGGRGRRRRRSPARALVRRDYFREALAYFRLDCMARGVSKELWERWEAFLPQSPPPPDVSRWRKKAPRAQVQGQGPAQSPGPSSSSEQRDKESPKESPPGAKSSRRRRRRRGGRQNKAEDPTPVTSAPVEKEKAAPLEISEIMPEDTGGAPLINPYTGKPYTRREDTTAAAAAKPKVKPESESESASESQPESDAASVPERAASGEEGAPKKKRRRRRRRRKPTGENGGTGGGNGTAATTTATSSEASEGDGGSQ